MPRRTVPSPLLVFPLLWCAGVALSQIHLLNFQSSWSALAWTVMAAVPLAFVAGGVAGRELLLRRLRREGGPATRRQSLATSGRLRAFLVACLVLGYLELAHQFIGGDGVPLFADKVDASRVSAPGGPTVLLTDLLTAAAIVALCVHRDLRSREARFELTVAAIALFGFVLAGGRGTIVLPVVTAMLARGIFWGLPSARTIALGASALAAFVAAAFFFRTSQNAGNLFEGELYAELLPTVPFPLRPLVPLHIGLTTNFQALANIVDFFPDRAPFGGGIYNSHGLDLVITNAGEVGEATGDLNGVWVTTTVAGTLWADGGLPVVVFGLALIGAVSVAAYTYATWTRSFAGAMIAGLLFYLVLFGVYTNLWTQHLDWFLISLVLLPASAIARDPTWPQPQLRRWGPSIPGLRRYAAAMATAGGEGSGAGGGNAGEPGPLSRWLKGRRITPLLWAAGAAAVLLVAALIIQLTTPSGAQPTEDAVAVADELPLPDGRAPGAEALLVTDGDLSTDNTPFWSVTRKGPNAEVRAFYFDENGDVSASTVAGVPVGGDPDLVFDVAEWDRQPALFTIAPGPRSAAIQIWALSPGVSKGTGSAEEPEPVDDPPLLGSFTAPLSPPDPRGEREFAIGTWSRSLPDLFVIDRGLPRTRPTVTVISGESGFTDVVAEQRLPLVGLDPDEWLVDVGRYDGTKSDLFMIARSGSSGGPEIHVLRGEDGLGTFALQRPADLPDGLPGELRVQVGSALGTPTMYAIDLDAAQPRIALLPLGQLPSGF